MVRYNPTCILRNIDLDNPRELRIIMTYLASQPLTLLTPALCEDHGIRPSYLGPINRIISAIEVNCPTYPLLERVISRFVQARKERDEQVLQATSILEEVASEDVLRSPSCHESEYAEAVERYEEIMVREAGRKINLAMRGRTASDGQEAKEEGRQLRKRAQKSYKWNIDISGGEEQEKKKTRKKRK